jgi:hypothetical protein
MTKDEIIEMAAEIWNAGSYFPIPSGDDILRFAALIVAKERENWSEVEAYLIAASEGSMSRNNSEALANELLTAIRERE